MFEKWSRNSSNRNVIVPATGQYMLQFPRVAFVCKKTLPWVSGLRTGKVFQMYNAKKVKLFGILVLQRAADDEQRTQICSASGEESSCRFAGSGPLKVLQVRKRILKSILCFTGKQCNEQSNSDVFGGLGASWQEHSSNVRQKCHRPLLSVSVPWASRNVFQALASVIMSLQLILFVN